MKNLKVWMMMTLLVLSFKGMAQQKPVNKVIDVLHLVDEVDMTTLADGRQILTDADGLSLYLFDVDTPGVSNCSGQCAVVWPVLTTEAEQLPEPFSIFVRADGSKQIVVNGSPLYYFISDKNEGDILGDGLNGVWHIIEVDQ